MFALANNKKLENKIGHLISNDVYELSPSLCKIYEKSLIIDFFNKENKSYLKFNYTSPVELNESNKETKFTIERHLFADNDPNKNQLKNQLTSKLNFRLNAHVERFTLALNDDNILSSSNQIEILRLTGERVSLCAKRFDLVTSSLMSVNLKCMNVQLDNQMFDNENYIDTELNGQQLKYDFPVIFLPREESKAGGGSRFTKSFDQTRVLNNPHIDSAFLDVKLILAEQDSKCYIPTSLEINLKPFDVYLEDYLLYNLTQIFIDYFDHLSTIESQPKSGVVASPAESDDDLSQLVKPLLLIHKFKINNIDSLVNLETKLKIYLATYKMPIKFEKFELNGLPFQQFTTKHLIKLFTNHYLTALIFRVGWLLGSLDLIGSPTVFIQQASNGLYDFMFMPYKGLRTSGANGLISGFSSGSLSLLRNLSAGSITSLTSFASFISRNMDVLSFDQNHLIRQDQIRHEILSPQASSPNFLLNVSTSFIITIMGAIGGLAEQPMQSVVNSESIIKGKFSTYYTFHSIRTSN
jgi:vacuolar protein sorting-associated protein 13B